MECLIIKKWLEPYVLLESLKSNFPVEDLTFDSFTKSTMKTKMLKTIIESEGNCFGLYMKNVNKFYVFTSDIDINKDYFIETLKLKEEDFEHNENIDSAIGAIDMAKAEVSILF